MRNTDAMRDVLHILMLRELRAVEQQIAAYSDDASVWKIVPGISNSGGTLVLHIAGNLRHFIGGVLGGSGYSRNRDAEFTKRGLSREKLAAEIRSTITELSAAFPVITGDQLTADYPLLIRDRRVRTGDFLIHLAVHLGYHLGQLDYHRRLLTPAPRQVENLAPGDLPQPN